MSESTYPSPQTETHDTPQPIRFDYYCTACGKKRKGAERCPVCGALKDELRFKGISRVGAAGIGYSDKIDDPTFSSYKKGIRRLALPISLGIGLLIFVILLITGAKLGPSAIFGGVFFVIFFIPLICYGRKKKSWEGTVVDKKHYPPLRRHHTADYYIRFKTADETIKKQKYFSHTDVFDYLNEGDRVRFVGEIGREFAYEKYDKSKDSSITCAACGFYQDPRSTYCSACGCLLLKGKPVSE